MHFACFSTLKMELLIPTEVSPQSQPLWAHLPTQKSWDIMQPSRRSSKLKVKDLVVLDSPLPTEYHGRDPATSTHPLVLYLGSWDCQGLPGEPVRRPQARVQWAEIVSSGSPAIAPSPSSPNSHVWDLNSLYSLPCVLGIHRLATVFPTKIQYPHLIIWILPFVRLTITRFTYFHLISLTSRYGDSWF